MASTRCCPGRSRRRRCALADRLPAFALAPLELDPERLGAALREAALAAAAVEAGATTAADALGGSFRLLVRLASEQPGELRRFAASTVGPLEDVAVVEHAEAYFAHDCNMNATATAIYAHRHTVAYRLERVHDLTGLSPLQPGRPRTARPRIEGKGPAVTRELSYLRLLEAEAIFVMREVAAEFERPVLLFSGGKDSIVLLRLAEKAFRPARFPFPIMHVDTGHNFPEVIEFRDRRVAELGERLIVASVQESIDAGRVAEETGAARLAQPAADDDAARRDRRATASTPRSAARAATRSGRGRRSGSSPSATTSASGIPRASAPSCGTSTTARVRKGEHVRVFPLSNWTELDVWQYIARRAARAAVDLLRPRAQRHRPRRDALADSEHVPRHERRGAVRGVGPLPHGRRHGVHRRRRARRPTTLEDVVAEIAATRITERGETRADDRVSEAAMEDRKREGYF